MVMSLPSALTQQEIRAIGVNFRIEEVKVPEGNSVLNRN